DNVYNSSVLIDREGKAVVLTTVDNVRALAVAPERLPEGFVVEVERADDRDLGTRAERGVAVLPPTGRPLRATVSGNAAWASLRLQSRPAGAVGPAKRPGRCGPVKEAFNAPFLLVRGTRADEATLEHLAELADRFAEEWRAFAKGRPRVKDDVDVTPEDVARYNLVCIGSPRTNAALAPLAERLPFGMDAGGYAVGDAAVARRPGRALGFLACYPHPDAPERLLVIMDGLYYGDHLPINHKWDLAPDYLVFTAARGPRDTNAAVLAGNFDSDWRIDPALQYTPTPAE
ncbi:MAG: hypothetical protein ACOCX4_08865, partial [Planctomycetota bacterium]